MEMYEYEATSIFEILTSRVCCVVDVSCWVGRIEHERMRWKIEESFVSDP